MHAGHGQRLAPMIRIGMIRFPLPSGAAAHFGQSPNHVVPSGHMTFQPLRIFTVFPLYRSE
jgi:hypothetical protein